jgi:CubicO group peptidase (beta-lactamase class C family)
MFTRSSSRGLLIALVVWLSVGITHAADMLPRVTHPEEVGLSSERLERLAQVTQAHVETGQLPGAVIVLARHGKIAYFASFGYRDRAKEAPMTTDAIFRIYSMTKPITSVAVMMLHEEGKLQLYDPVSLYLSELAKPKVGVEKTDPGTGQKTFETVEAQREITVQDLLRHTSGFTYGRARAGDAHVKKLYREAKIGERADTNAALVTKLSQLPLLYQPGTRWEYSVSTDVLGRLVEVVSGQSLSEFFAERILRPLGMQDTGFHVPADKLDRAAQPWARAEDPPMTRRFDVAMVPKFQSGGGGLVSTALDYLRFAQMLLNGGAGQGVRLLGRKTVEFMTADHLGSIPYEVPGMGFGLGFQVRRDAGIARLPGSVGEYGWAGNAGTLFWIDPTEQLIAIYMIQVSDTDRVYLRNQFKSLVSQAIIDRGSSPQQDVRGVGVVHPVATK